MKYSNIELAKICAKYQCKDCPTDVKKECLLNDCWKAYKPYDKKPPAVYYGVIKSEV